LRLRGAPNVEILGASSDEESKEQKELKNLQTKEEGQIGKRPHIHRLCIEVGSTVPGTGGGDARRQQKRERRQRTNARGKARDRNYEIKAELV